MKIRKAGGKGSRLLDILFDIGSFTLMKTYRISQIQMLLS